MESYKNLSSFIMATVIYDLTVAFCDKYIPKNSRTHDQMTQAGRSGKQNIAEGASVGSTESYLKLLGVAKGSFKELGEDYGDFLRQRKLEIWNKEDERIRNFRSFRAVWIDSNQTIPNTPNTPNDPKEFANMLLTFCQMETYLLHCQIKALEGKFVKDGGFRENLFKKRMDYKKGNLKQ